MGGNTTEKQSLHLDPFDLENFEDGLRVAPRLSEKVESEEKHLATVRELATDLFGAMFKYSPRLRDPQAMDPAFRVNHKLTGEGMGLSEYERLRLYTRLREVESAVATEVILSKVLESLSDEDRQAIQRAQEASQNHQQALSRLQALQEFLEENPQKVEEYHSEVHRSRGTQYGFVSRDSQYGEDLEKAQARAQQAQQDLQQAAQGMEQVLNSPSLRPALRQGMEEATEDLDAFEQFCLSWGAEAGELQRLPADAKMALMQEILESGKLRELARMVGRLKRLALSKRSTRITMVPEEVVDITQGSDLGRVLPSELVLLEDPDREMLFYERFLGGKLLEYELKGKEKVAKGPIVCCIDNSGSMKLGGRELWSKAVALALAEICRQEKRHFYVVHFGSKTDPLKTFGIDPKDRGEERLRKMLDIATYFLGGGTDFEEPLTEAVAVIGGVSRGALKHGHVDLALTAYRKADIVFITDGGARLSDLYQKAFLMRKAELEIRVFSIIILGTEETLEAVSDETFHLMDLVKQGDSVAGRIFEGV